MLEFYFKHLFPKIKVKKIIVPTKALLKVKTGKIINGCQCPSQNDGFRIMKINFLKNLQTSIRITQDMENQEGRM